MKARSINRILHLGFRRHEGQLIAVAGPTSRPLDEAMDVSPPDRGKRLSETLMVVVCAAAVVAAVAAVLCAVHENRHSLLTISSMVIG